MQPLMQTLDKKSKAYSNLNPKLGMSFFVCRKIKFALNLSGEESLYILGEEVADGGDCPKDRRKAKEEESRYLRNKLTRHPQPHKRWQAKTNTSTLERLLDELEKEGILVEKLRNAVLDMILFRLMVMQTHDGSTLWRIMNQAEYRRMSRMDGNGGKHGPGGTGKDNKSDLYDKNGKYTGGRTQEELDDLATDPDRGHILDDQGKKEREVGLAVEERGDLGRIKRDSGGAEFYDELSPNQQRWDVKSYESYPNGHTDPKKGAFSVKTTLKNMYKKLNKGINIIVDTRQLIPEHIEQLKEAIVKEGLVDRVIWYP